MFEHWRSKRAARETHGKQKRTAHLRVEALEDRMVLSTVGDGNARFVAQTYAQLFQRGIDTKGLTYWTAQMDQGTSRTEIAYDLATSDEGHTALVQYLYRTFLGRAADPSGLDYYASQLDAGATAEQVEAQLFGSDEYFQTRGTGSAGGYLAALYSDVLDRGLDPSGSDAFTAALASGVSRQDVAATVLASPEASQDLVVNLYRQFLQREADPSGLTFYVNELQGGVRDEMVVAQMIGSNEVFADAQSPATSTYVNPSVSQPLAGQDVTLTASVYPAAYGVGMPTGTVTFKDGSSVLGASTLDGNASASIDAGTFSTGNHTITVSYGGDSDFNASDSTEMNLVVGQDTTSTTVGSGGSTVAGQQVTLTATVEADSPGSGTPTGSITFQEGETTLGTANLDANGQAKFAMSNLSVGEHAITAVYDGDTNFSGSTSSSALTQSVARDTSTTTLSDGGQSPVFGQNLSITANVVADNPGSGTPTGQVSFSVDGGESQTAALVNGSAALPVGALSVGQHTVTLNYAGDANFVGTGQTPATMTFAVGQASQMITFDPILDQYYGATIPLAATSSSGLPVSYSVLGAATLSGDVVHGYALTVTGTGSVTVTATQAGDANHLPATPAAQLFAGIPAPQSIYFTLQNVQPNGPTSVVLSAQSGVGLPVHYTLVSGNGSLGTGANANVLTINGAGTFSVTASQPGNANYQAAPNVTLTFQVDLSNGLTVTAVPVV